MVKYITKTTTEYVYDKEGRVLKEIKTEEYHEEEAVVKATVSTKPSDIYTQKAVGVPYTSTWNSTEADKNNIVHSISVNSAKSVNEIANEVKAILKKELKDEIKLTPRKPKFI